LNNIDETTKFIRHGIEYSNKSISTGDDYPQWWIQLSTNVILSNYITNQNEKKKKQFDQSIQNYEIIDQTNDGNNSRRFLPFQDPVNESIFSKRNFYFVALD
jgi:hypothetical protein